MLSPLACLYIVISFLDMYVKYCLGNDIKCMLLYHVVNGICIKLGCCHNYVFERDIFMHIIIQVT